MRLSDFIVQHVDRIVDEWEQFAKSIAPAADSMTRLQLRDHAKSILLAAARDMRTAQTAHEQQAKAKGEGPEKPQAWMKPPPAMANCGTPWALTWCR